MSRSGQNVFKGINTQVLASLSLLLQYLRDPKFSHIHLEAPNSEDFDLVFSDGRRIICESKDRKKPFNYSHLRKLVTSLRKKGRISKQDELLVVCSQLSEGLDNVVKNSKYFDRAKMLLIKKGFSKDDLEIISRTSFWKIPEAFSENMVCILFSELLDFWLSKEDINNVLRSLRVRFYETSQKGRAISRKDLFNTLEETKKQLVESTGFYRAKRTIDEILNEVSSSLDKSGSILRSDKLISALSTQPSIAFYAINKLQDRKLDDLEDYKEFLKLVGVIRYSGALIKIFENNLHTEKNRAYVLDFLKENIGEARKFFHRDFFNIHVIEITKKIISIDPHLANEAFEITQKLLSAHSNAPYFIEGQGNDDWDMRQICGLLIEIYKVSNYSLRTHIIELIFERLNLVEDDGEYEHEIPFTLYQILNDWLCEDFKHRFPIAIEKLVKQYDVYYGKFGKRYKFDGWELMGGVTSFSGGNYVAHDKHFVAYFLCPAFSQTYEDKSHINWDFLMERCYTKTNRVSRQRPDFLNRALIPILIKRYYTEDAEISHQAFSILRDFILSKKGIPHKSELIYQLVRSEHEKDLNKSWKISEVSIKRFGIPINPFVEDTIGSLTRLGHHQAQETMKLWVKDDRYYKQSFLGPRILMTLKSLINSDFAYALDLFQQYIQSDFFVNKQDDHDAHETCEILRLVFERDFQKALEIVRDIESSEALTKNQQILITSGLFNLGKNDDAEDEPSLIKTYEDIISDRIKNLTQQEYRDKFWFSHSRESMVQFASKLAHKRRFEEALSIVEYFINDPDPYLPSQDPEDPENKYNEHKNIEKGVEPHIITSVRGYCGWTLAKCSVLSARPYLERVIGLTEKLIKDDNYYVKHMASFSLGQLLQNRLSVLPDNPSTLFFHDDTRQALLLSKRVESIAFTLLESIAQASAEVQKAMTKSLIHVLIHLKAINQEQALKMIHMLKMLPHESIGEMAPIFMFFSEFRKHSYPNWRWGAHGLYEDLGQDSYNEELFRTIVLNILNTLPPSELVHFALFCSNLLEHSKEEDHERNFEIAAKYLTLLTKRYDHELFQRIHQAIEQGLRKGYDLERLFSVFQICLETERGYFSENQAHLAQMVWYPSLYNDHILKFLFERGETDKFLDALSIIVSFPKGLYLHVDGAIPLLEHFMNTPQRSKARSIVRHLFESDPGRFYDLWKKWKKAP